MSKKVFFSGDFHLNHPNIVGPKVSKWKGGYRDFDSLIEMNEEIIKTINKYVEWDDELQFLGDFCFGDRKLTRQWRDRINCQTIHLVLGNHENVLYDGPEGYRYKDVFASVREGKMVNVDGHDFYAAHYKHAIWPDSHKGAIHVYAHSHASAESWKIGKSMDVGIDNAKRLFGEYRPFESSEIVQIFKNTPIHEVDHHASK